MSYFLRRIKRWLGLWKLSRDDEPLWHLVNSVVGNAVPPDVFAENLDAWREFRREHGFGPIGPELATARPYFDDCCYYWGLALPAVAPEELH